MTFQYNRYHPVSGRHIEGQNLKLINDHLWHCIGVDLESLEHHDRGSGSQALYTTWVPTSLVCNSGSALPHDIGMREDQSQSTQPQGCLQFPAGHPAIVSVDLLSWLGLHHSFLEERLLPSLFQRMVVHSLQKSSTDVFSLWFWFQTVKSVKIWSITT